MNGITAGRGFCGLTTYGQGQTFGGFQQATAFDCISGLSLVGGLDAAVRQTKVRISSRSRQSENDRKQSLATSTYIRADVAREQFGADVPVSSTRPDLRKKLLGDGLGASRVLACHQAAVDYELRRPVGALLV